MIKGSFFVICGFVVVGLVSIAMGVMGGGMHIEAPSEGTFASTANGLLFNVTYANGSDIISPTSATFFLNASEGWAVIGTVTGCTANACFGVLTGVNVVDGLYSVNATLTNGSDSVSILEQDDLGIFVIDTTVPTISHSCSPLSVTEGGSVSCSCTATDGESGLNESYGDSGVLFEENPGTQTSGNLSTACSALDMAGNLATSNIYYIVNDETSSGASTVSSAQTSQQTTTPEAELNSTASNATEQNITTEPLAITANLLKGNQGIDPTPERQRKADLFVIAVGVIVLLFFLFAFALIRRARRAKKKSAFLAK